MRAIIMALACAALSAAPAGAERAKPHALMQSAPEPAEETVQIPPEQRAPSVADTHWAGVFDWNNGDEHREATLWFRTDGVVVYGYDGLSYDNGRWRQRGPLVLFDTNEFYAVYAGQVSGDRITGTSYSVNGWNGRWDFTRAAAPPPGKGGH